MEPSTIIIIIIASIIVWLLLREVNAWYWKTNRIIVLLEEILAELRLSRKPSQSGMKEESKQWKCPQCQSINPNNTYKCEKCGYNLV